MPSAATLHFMKNEYHKIINIVEDNGWVINEIKLAKTNSIYMEIYRTKDDQKEWAIIRIADHAQVYDNWLKVYSFAPNNLWIEELEEILSEPFGSVGDIL
jgi:hypothetical protein